MTAYFFRRFLLIIPTFFGVTFITFWITRMVPGGPLERQIMELRMSGRGRIDSGAQIPEQAMAELKRFYDLDKPWPIAYAVWLKKLVTLDLGRSYQFRRPVWDLIKERFPISIYFGLISFVLGYLVCIPLGIFKALRHGAPFDVISSVIVFVGYAIPGWALGALLLVLFAGGQFFNWFPLGGFRSESFDQLPSIVQRNVDAIDLEDRDGNFDWNKLSFPFKAMDQLHHTILPILCYMVGSFATLTVLMKNSILENLGQDYVRTAFAKGLSSNRVIFVHTLRNSLIPLATGLGHFIAVIMTGSYLIEWVFNINGLGYLGYNSLVSRDYAVVMGILAINTLLTLVGNILSDVLYAVIDPRIRFS